MLRLMQQEDEPLLHELCQQEPVFGTTLLTLWFSHQKNWRDFTAWIGLDGHRKPRYALCRYGHRYTLCAPRGLTPFCQEELTHFLRLESEIWLEGDSEVLRYFSYRLGLERMVRPILRCCGHGTRETIPACTQYNVLFDLISQTEAMGRQTWLSRMFPLFRDGMCVPFMLKEQGQPVSCAILEHAPNCSFGVITSVVTAPAFRGQGFGKAIVEHLCAYAQSIGCVPYLVCGESSLTAFYTPLGFQPVSQQYGLLRGKPE